jgi:leader peptidase (prepilin peptidase) / N-methyltransferase
MQALRPVVLIFAIVGAPAGLLLAWAVGRFEGAGEGRRAWLALALPLILALTAALTRPAQWPVGVALAVILLMISAVDALTLRIPDLLSLPLIALGLAVGSAGQATLMDRLAGAALGFLVLTALAWGYRALRGREGLGLGDAKLLAAGGAWVGWQGLPTILLLAAGGGFLLLAWGLLRRGGRAAADAIAFGPPLAAGIWVAWLLAAGQGAV